MEKIPVAIIGLGRIASLLEQDSRREKPCTHAGAVAANSACFLAGGCDTDEDRRGLFAGRWGVPVYVSAEEMIRAQSPKILVIATHPDSHYYYCRMAAALGVPVVICEKPLADTLPAARKIARLVKGGNGIAIITNHERRYSADYIKAKEILASGKLGDILSVRGVLYMGRNKRLLDVFWHDGTHLADAIMFLTDSRLKHRRRLGAKLTASEGTVWLEAEAARTHSLPASTPVLMEIGAGRDHDDPASIPVIMEIGAGRDHDDPASIPVIMEIGAGRDHLVFEIEFSCAKGRLRIGNGVFEVWESAESPYAEKFRSLKRTDAVFKNPTGYFVNMLADAVSCVLEPGRAPVSSAGDGLKVIEYLDSVKTWK